MIQRLYVNNFRSLQNFDFSPHDLSSLLLIGDNGSGKSCVGHVLGILQKIARGTNRVGNLVKPRNFSFTRTESPMRFQLEVQLKQRLFSYRLALELPEGFHEARVLDESLSVDGAPVYEREVAQVRLRRPGFENYRSQEASFLVDWHLVALPLIQQTKDDAISEFREWLARSVILRPVPSLIRGQSVGGTLELLPDATNVAEWFSGLISYAPRQYSTIHDYLREYMQDLREIRNPEIAENSRSLSLRFARDRDEFTLPLEDLSDGEKCHLICGLVLAANVAYGPILCFWDEPDNYLAPKEVSNFIMSLRRAFRDHGQFIATSHNTEAIRTFSEENTFVLSREGHLEPSILRPLSDLKPSGDLVRAIVRGDI